MTPKDPTQRSATRRAFLASLAAGAGVFGIGRASADIEDYESAKADHVSITFDRDRLERIRPYFTFPSDMTERPSAVYAWISESPEWDVVGHTFVVFYQTQDPPEGVAQHRYDREIVQVYTHPEYGNVEEIVYSAGHWRAQRDTAPNVHEPDGTNEEHVTLLVDGKYHHFYPTTEVGGIGADLEPLGTDATLFDENTETTQYEQFLASGWDPDLRPGGLQNAARMRYRPHYWSAEADRKDRLAAAWGYRFRGTRIADYMFEQFGTEAYSD